MSNIKNGMPGRRSFRALSRAGFTLIELLVVVLIIGILSAVALPEYTRAVGKARVTEAIVALKAVTDAQEVFYMANGQYATSLEDLDVEVNPDGKYYSYTCSSGRTCFAKPKLTDYPYLEFHMKLATTGAQPHYLGKHWCQISGIASEKARAICKSLGPVDASMNGNYYLIQQ